MLPFRTVLLSTLNYSQLKFDGKFMKITFITLLFNTESRKSSFVYWLFHNTNTLYLLVAILQHNPIPDSRSEPVDVQDLH